jgi:hypothetical protein
MKVKTTIAVLTTLVVAASAFGQGQLNWSTTPSKPVRDEQGTALPAGVALAGLYFTTDLAAPDPGPMPLPDDGWLLADTAPVGSPFAGYYSGGTVDFDAATVGLDLVAGTEILVQVRAWSAAYENYAAAWADPTGINNGGVVPVAGASIVLPRTLGGGTLPVDSISTDIQSFTVLPVPEPSTIALGLVGGLGALLLLRRRK